MSIILKNIDLGYGIKPVFKDLNLHIPKAEITCIMGPSGCGKTSLLNLINRSCQPDQGKVIAHHVVLSQIFQESRLLPWKTALGNIKLVLKGVYEKRKRHEIAMAYLEMTGLSEFADYYPSQLSGGMKQRVSIARAFSFPSNTILMDEPFKGLDVISRRKLIDSFLSMWKEDKRTVIYVTHDASEIMEDVYQAVLLGPCPEGINTIFYKNEVNGTTLQQLVKKNLDKA